MGIFALTLWGSVVWAIIVMAILLLIAIWSEIKKDDGSGFGVYLVIVIVLFAVWGDYEVIRPYLTWQIGAGYLGVGFVYAAIRTIQLGRKKSGHINDGEEGDGYNSRSSRLASLKSDLVDNVFRWWSMWPVSLPLWFLSDVIRIVWEWIYKAMKGFFEWLIDLGVGSKKN